MGGEDFTSLIIIITLMAHSPAIIMAIIGWALYATKPETAKVLFIISTIYVIIGLGICASILS